MATTLFPATLVSDLGQNVVIAIAAALVVTLVLISIRAAVR